MFNHNLQEDPGESLSDADEDDEEEKIEVEKEKLKCEEDDDSEDGFLVPDGYLSDNEVCSMKGNFHGCNYIMT